MGFIIIYSTHPNQESAKKISDLLIEQKLVACSNIFPIQSSYWWAGKIENEEEVVCITKTIQENYDKVKKEIEKLHSYEVPCIMKMEVSANEAYENWIREAVILNKN